MEFAWSITFLAIFFLLRGNKKTANSVISYSKQYSDSRIFNSDKMFTAEPSRSALLWWYLLGQTEFSPFTAGNFEVPISTGNWCTQLLEDERTMWFASTIINPVRTLQVAPLWCDLGFFPNSRGNKAAANLIPKSACCILHWFCSLGWVFAILKCFKPLLQLTCSLADSWLQTWPFCKAFDFIKYGLFLNIFRNGFLAPSCVSLVPFRFYTTVQQCCWHNAPLSVWHSRHKRLDFKWASFTGTITVWCLGWAWCFLQWQASCFLIYQMKMLFHFAKHVCWKVQSNAGFNTMDRPEMLAVEVICHLISLFQKCVMDMLIQSTEQMNASSTELIKKILIEEERLDYLGRAQEWEQMTWRDPAALKNSF